MSRLSPLLLPSWPTWPRMMNPQPTPQLPLFTSHGSPKDTSLCSLLHKTGFYSFSRTWGLLHKIREVKCILQAAIYLYLEPARWLSRYKHLSPSLMTGVRSPGSHNRENHRQLVVLHQPHEYCSMLCHLPHHTHRTNKQTLKCLDAKCIAW